jgi:hypothetical protein
VVPALRAAFGDEDAEDPHYAASFTVLAECVKHHVKEEEGDMFPEAKKAKLDLDDLGAQMRARKADGRSRRPPLRAEPAGRRAAHAAARPCLLQRGPPGIAPDLVRDGEHERTGDVRLVEQAQAAVVEAAMAAMPLEPPPCSVEVQDGAEQGIV